MSEPLESRGERSGCFARDTLPRVRGIGKRKFYHRDAETRRRTKIIKCPGRAACQRFPLCFSVSLRLCGKSYLLSVRGLAGTSLVQIPALRLSQSTAA